MTFHRPERAVAALALAALCACASDGRPADEARPPAALGSGVASTAPRAAAAGRAPSARPAGVPLTLDAAVARALADNPSLEEAAARIEGAAAQERAARAAWQPRLGLGAELTRTDNPVLAFMGDLNARELDPLADTNSPRDTNHVRLGLTLSMLVYDGGARAARRSGARLGRRIAELSDRVARRELGAAVVSAWLSAHEAEARRESARATLEWAERELASARLREQEGAALRSDALSLEVRRDEAREAATRAESARRIALEGLRRLIGAAPGEELELAPAGGEPPVLELAEPGVELALARRAEIELAQQALDVAREGVRAARSSSAPRVSVFANGWLDGGHELDSLDAESYLAGVALDWSLYDGARAPRTAAARAAVRAANAAMETTRAAVVQESRAALLRRDDALARLASASSAAASAEEALRLVGLRFSEGAATATEVLEAESALAAARARRTSARFDLARAGVEVRRAHGLDALSTDLANPHETAEEAEQR